METQGTGFFLISGHTHFIFTFSCKLYLTPSEGILQGNKGVYENRKSLQES